MRYFFKNIIKAIVSTTDQSLTRNESNKMSINNISLYIPHIFANFSKEFVAGLFADMNIGKVKHIDFVLKVGKDGKEYNSAYIHFEHWYENPEAREFQERVLNQNKEARIVYDEPWYWIVLENKSCKVESGARKPRIDLGTSHFSPLSNETSLPVSTRLPEIKSLKVAESFNPDDFEEFFEPNEEQEAEMDEIEAALQEKDKYFMRLDIRYVETIEAENIMLREQVAYFQHLLATEQIKTQALADAIAGNYKVDK